MIFFGIFFAIPFIEIALFAGIGGEIGVWNTLFLCVLMAVIGGALVRYQGLHTLLSARSSIEKGDIPLDEFFDGLCLSVAGVLLITPGFFTDFLGFCLLIPPIRKALRHYLAVRLGFGPVNDNKKHAPDFIETAYEWVDDEDKT